MDDHDTSPAGVEYLESGAARPLSREQRRRRARGAIIAGTGVLSIGLVGGAAAAAWWWLADGPQAAEGMPSSVVTYVGVTLDPSGEQQLEALRTMQRFPALAEDLDLDTDLRDIDLKEALGTAFIDSAPCRDLDYDDHLRPWLGDRAGMGMLLVDDEPAPMITLEATDEDAAETGMEAVVSCGDDGEGFGGSVFAVRDGWVLLAPEQAVLDTALADLEEGSLAADVDFRRWSEEAGESGVVTMFAAAEAGPVLLDLVEEVAGATDVPAYGPATPGGSATVVPASATTVAGVPDVVREALEGFQGGGAQLRFRDGGLELGMAAAASEGDWSDSVSTGAGELLASLPGDTGLAYSYGLGAGWMDPLLAYVESDPSLGLRSGELAGLLESQVGITPADFEAALGSAAALVVGGDVDVDAVERGDLTSLPLALAGTGDRQTFDGAVDAVNRWWGPGQGLLASHAGEDRVVAGTSDAWARSVADGGDLGDSAVVRDVLPQLEDSMVATYVDLDAVRAVVVEVMESVGEDTDEVEEILGPLSAFGSSYRIDETGVVRGLLRVATD